MVVLGGVLRRGGDLAQHRPRVRGDGDPVAAYLLPEGLGLELARDREPRAAGDRPAHAHQQPGGVVDRGDGVDGVGLGERRRRRGRERRERPAAVRDPVRPRPLALAREEHEGEVAGATRVRRDTRRAARPGPGRSAPCRRPRRRGRGPPRRRRARGPGSRRRRRRAPASSGSATILVTWPSSASRATGAVGTHQHGDRAEPVERRDHRERRSGGCSSARRRARPGGRRARAGRGRRCRSRRLTASCVIGAVLEQKNVGLGVLAGAARRATARARPGSAARAGPSARAAGAGR